MAAHLPPVPPANRTDKGPGEPAQPGKAPDRDAAARPGTAPGNTHEQGGQGNMEQNTRHPGSQQGR